MIRQEGPYQWHWLLPTWPLSVCCSLVMSLCPAVCCLSFTYIVWHFWIFVQTLLGFVENAGLFYRLYYTVLLIISIHYFRKKIRHNFLSLKTNILHVQSPVAWSSGLYRGERGSGPKYRGNRTTERKLRSVGKIQKSWVRETFNKFLKRKYLNSIHKY